jgi:hypothetical protein
MRTRGLGWALVLMVGMIGGAALGQEPPKPRGPVGQPTPAVESELTLSVDFPGGTVGQYIDALKKAAGRNAVNVVASRQAMEVPVAPISLRDISLYAALSAVQGAGGREIRWDVRPLGLSPSKNAEAWALEMQPTGQVAQMGPAQRSQPEGGIRVFSLRDLTEPLPGDPPGVALTKSPEIVLTAVRAALDLAGNQGGDPPEMKFHEDSGLLIVHGNNEQIGAVMQTLDQMKDDIRRRRDAAKLSMQPRVDVDEVRSQMEKEKVHLNQAQRDLDRTSRALEMGRKLVDSGQMSAVELSDVEAKHDEAQARVQMVSIDLQRMQKVLEDAQQEGRMASPGARQRASLAQIDQEVGALIQQRKALTDKGVGTEHRDVKALDEQIKGLLDQKARLAQERAEAGQGNPGAPAGRSVAIYDLADSDAKAREQLISSIRALEKAINDPGKLKIQSIQGESKLVIEADGAMQAVVRGMCKEVMGARGEPGKADDKPKPRGK